MLKFRIGKKQVRFLLISFAGLLFFSELFAEEEEPAEINYPVPPPLVYRGLYPCQACHRRNVQGVSSELDKKESFLGKYIRLPDPRRRILVRMHRDITLKHAEWHWCLNCHDTDERNALLLMTGEKISFEQSYRLCGQCHGTIYRDWKLGIHGRRVGQWNGKKLYLLCAHCHDPHKPKFRKLPAKDAPHFIKHKRWKYFEQHEQGHENRIGGYKGM